jgi:hypothetical protein
VNFFPDVAICHVRFAFTSILPSNFQLLRCSHIIIARSMSVTEDETGIFNLYLWLQRYLRMGACMVV